jgi:hypothetical protein
MIIFQKKARIAFSDQEGRNELLDGDDPRCSEDQVCIISCKKVVGLCLCCVFSKENIS